MAADTMRQQSAGAGGSADGNGAQSAEQEEPGGLKKAAWRAIRLNSSGGARYARRLTLKPLGSGPVTILFMAKG